MGTYPIDLAGVDYLVAHGYKWAALPARALRSSTSAPKRRVSEIAPTGRPAGSRCPDPYEDYYGLPELTDEAR